MPNFHRCRVPGGCTFFTVNLFERHGNSLLVTRIDLLRDAVRRVRRVRPFTIDASVVLPDHLHAVWTLPPGDDDFSTRWRLIKTFFARGLPKTEWLSRVRSADGERGIRQRRLEGARGAHGLRSFQSGQARPRHVAGGLAILHVPRLRGAGSLSC